MRPPSSWPKCGKRPSRRVFQPRPSGHNRLKPGLSRTWKGARIAYGTGTLSTTSLRRFYQRNTSDHADPQIGRWVDLLPSSLALHVRNSALSSDGIDMSPDQPLPAASDPVVAIYRVALPQVYGYLLPRCG